MSQDPVRIAIARALAAPIAALFVWAGPIGAAGAGAAVPQGGGPPIIELSTDRVEFAADPGADPPDREVELRNAGHARLHWDASADAEWLRVSPDDGDLRADESRDLRIRVDSDDLAPGRYEAAITVTGNAPNAPQAVAVVLTVGAPAVLELAVEAVDLEADEGSGPAERSVALTNVGGAVLAWTAAADSPWISIAPGSGQLGPGVTADVAVVIATGDLDPGSHAATVMFDGNAANAPLSVDVHVTVRTELVLEQMVAALAGAETLSEGQARFLDRNGNENGRFDLGDFLAWLDGGSSSDPGGGDDG